MQEYINIAAGKILEIARFIADEMGELASFAFIGYRDYGDSEQLMKYPFCCQGDLPAFASYIGSIKAQGGADPPEDIYGAFSQIPELDWQSPVKIIIHIADAPCHGLKYHDSRIPDHYPSGDPDGDPAELLSVAADIGIDYYFLRLNSYTDQMLEAFKQSYNGRPAMFAVIPFETAHGDNPDPKNFLKIVKTSIMTSVRN